MKKPIKILLVAAAAAVLLSIFFILFFKGGKDRHPGPGKGKYNVVLIVSDALRRDMLGCYGGKAQTPNLDWLARNGTVFENAYSTAPCTMPSSVSMLTGNYSRAYGILEKGGKTSQKLQYLCYVNDDEKLLAEALTEQGYDVLMDLENPLAGQSNNLQGFKKFPTLKQMTGEQITLVHQALGIKASGPKKGLLSYYKYFYGMLHYLLTVKEDRHFFVLKWFTDPHCPYSPPREFKKKILIDPAKLPQKENFYYKNRVGAFIVANNKKKFSEYENHYIRELYKAEVEYVDERVGYIIKALKQRGLMDKTLIVFTSDHGELLGEHDWYGHEYHIYEPLVRVPLVISGPGIPKGKRETAAVSHLDLMPTLKDFLGIRYPDTMSGESYRGLLSGGSAPGRNLYIDRVSNTLDIKTDSDALVMGDYKLVVKKTADGYELKLYNLKDDPDETRDIFEKNPQLGKKMFKQIQEIREENKKRYKENLARIGRDVNLDAQRKKTLEKLKTMGYLD